MHAPCSTSPRNMRFALGWPAFLFVGAIFYLMVSKGS
ncbi:DUF2269 domain-containing protein [Pseudomonas sp. Q2-TVG4-2]|nr:DUF2269 domain-containing protein [Pseudomonas sp. Q2-TVG4-2]